MSRPTPVQKLTPTAYDRWWRTRIEKEEGTYADKTVQSTHKTVALNTLGAPQVVHTTALEDHLVGAGAVVRSRAVDEAPSTSEVADIVLPDISAKGPGSVASNARGSGSVASNARGSGSVVSNARGSGSVVSIPKSKVGSGSVVEGRSGISYPKTPNFSAAGASATDSQIIGRLARLEQDLARERTRREAAEREMRGLLSAAGLSPRSEV